ncbi:MAG: ATP-binding cassette domain-containing protein, partial [Rhodospirillales bacterium]|nr:ATP-binding cassette domain-containing protein [Rhodospirillales bacterium]
RSEIEHAATAARIKDYIDGLPDGYNTLLEVGGGILSGGQRQRIAIARAFLQDPLVLILDEATSSVDTETAIAIIQTVDSLFSDRTRIVVSHHEEPLADADVVAELRNGQLHLLNSKQSAIR